MGYFEQIEIDKEPRCDDHTLQRGPMQEAYEVWAGTTEQNGRSGAYNPNTPRIIKEVGYVDVKDEVIRLPLNKSWQASGQGQLLPPFSRLLGNWYSGQCENALDGLYVGPLTRCAGWPLEKWRAYEQDILDIMTDPEVHVYHEL